MIKSIREFQHHQHNHQKQSQIPPINIPSNHLNQQKITAKSDNFEEIPSEGLPSQQSLASIEWQVEEKVYDIQITNPKTELPATSSISQIANNLTDQANKNNILGIQALEDNKAVNGNSNKNGNIKKLARLSNGNVTQPILDVEDNNDTSAKEEDEEKEDNLICNYGIDNMRLSS